MKRSLKKVAGTSMSFILLALLIGVGYIAVSAKVTGDTPNLFGYELLTVLSGSMEPSIKTGSIIAVKPIRDSSQLKVNDVITYRAIDQQNILITHRITKINVENGKRIFVTKGDNNESADLRPVPEEYVISKYSGFTIPFVGKLIGFVRTKAGILTLIIIPGIVLFFWQIKKLWSYLKMHDDKDQPVS